MITGLRAAIICDKVEKAANGKTNFLGLYGASLAADGRPGFVEVWLALAVETDRKATDATIRVEAASYDYVFPMRAPAGPPMIASAFQLLLPITEEGPLVVTIRNGDRSGRPIRVKWDLRFQPDAKVLDEALVKRMLETCRAAAETLALNLGGGATAH